MGQACRAPLTVFIAAAALGLLLAAAPTRAACIDPELLDDTLWFALDQLNATAATRADFVYRGRDGVEEPGYPNSTDPVTGEWRAF